MEMWFFFFFLYCSGRAWEVQVQSLSNCRFSKICLPYAVDLHVFLFFWNYLVDGRTAWMHSHANTHMPTLTCQRDKFLICTTEVLTNSVKRLNATLKFRILGVEHHVQVSQCAAYQWRPFLQISSSPSSLAEWTGARLAQVNSFS